VRPHSRRPRAAIAILALLLGAAACQKYVPANLPIQTEDSAEALAPRTAYRDDLGREIGGADADGPEYRITLQDGTQFFMKGPVIRGDSVIGYYRPTSGTAWARASIELTDMRLAERQETDWLATMSLATVPITLGLLLTW
jgi:hypothetical protein